MKAAEACVLLVGASGGIGRAIAAQLHAAGASLMLAARSEERLLALARELGGRGPHLALQAVELAEDASIDALAARAGAWGCNVLVHAAGVSEFGPFATVPPERLRGVLETNLLAPMRVTQALLPHLLARPRAQVICVGSALGAIGLPGYAAYGASKAGLRLFAQALRRELAGTAVRVQYLGPRTTRTAFNNEAACSYAEATGTASDDPADVARALVRLLESKAPERHLGWPERLGVRINGAAPGLLDGSFDRHRQALVGLCPSPTP
jgi:short-subunit dehydrogenase